MFIKSIILGFSLFFLSTTISFAGFGLEATRVIFNEGNNSASVVAFNTDKNINFLVQSWIENGEDQMTTDFVTTPPIFKLKAEHKNTIQITKNSNPASNKETLYWINVKFIAPQSKNAENILRYSMSNKIKLIYRPLALKNIDIQKEVEGLIWENKNGELSVRNNSPIYINIANIKINNQELEAPSYFPPHSTVKVKSTIKLDVNNSVTMRYINDYGTTINQNFTFKY